MTDTLTRWLGAAAINMLLVAPALAIDPNFGDEPPVAAPATPTTAASAPEAYNDKDDLLTQSVLKKLALKKLIVDAQADQPDNIKDPFQSFNRKIYSFNSKLDTYVLLPMARRYKTYVPHPIQSGLSHFFSNLKEPWNAVNSLLQGKPKDSGKSLGRFTVNTITTLGFADPATRLGLENHPEDFGQTLGVWGIGNGPYLMLPFLGPSTLRDTGGLVVDTLGMPQFYLHEQEIGWCISGAEAVDTRASLIGVEDIVQGDQYSLIRDLYLQHRQYAISGEKTDNSAIDSSFGDDSTETSPDTTKLPETAPAPVDPVQSTPATTETQSP